MIVRSMTRPRRPTTTGATAMPIQTLAPWAVTANTVKAPTMRNSACARLMTPIMPKITARPRARRMSVAIVYRMPNAVTATKSIVLRAAGPGRLQGGDATPTLELRRVLRGLIRVLDQIAHLHSVRGRDVRKRLDDREAALLVHFGEVHRVHDVVALGVERDVALWRLERQAALERLDDRVPLK